MNSLVSEIEWVETAVPRIPFGKWIETVFEWVQRNAGEFFDAVSALISFMVDGLAEILQWPAPIMTIIVFAAVAWLIKDWRLAAGSALGLLMIVSFDQWDNAMQTLALVLIATFFALLVGIPAGIAAARWEGFSTFIRPVMDLMQTMPAFVWLVPVVTLFSIGVPAGLVATVIFALPPAVRLTELGIRQVDSEVVEAGHAFGGTERQILTDIQLPLAMPTIMAGVNQVIMLALSMAVIAGLVGGGGLGSAVVTSISRLDIGLGFEAGLSVVAIAIYLDRVTAAASKSEGFFQRRAAKQRKAHAASQSTAEVSA